MNPIPPMSAASWYTTSKAPESSDTAASQAPLSRSSSRRKSSAAVGANSGTLMSARESDAGAALVRRVCESACRVDVVAQAGPLAVQHAPRGVHRPDHLHARDVLGDEHRVARLEQQVVARSGIAQRLREVDVDPARPVHLPV